MFLLLCIIVALRGGFTAIERTVHLLTDWLPGGSNRSNPELVIWKAFFVITICIALELFGSVGLSLLTKSWAGHIIGFGLGTIDGFIAVLLTIFLITDRPPQQ